MAIKHSHSYLLQMVLASERFDSSVNVTDYSWMLYTDDTDLRHCQICASWVATYSRHLMRVVSEPEPSVYMKLSVHSVANSAAG